MTQFIENTPEAHHKLQQLLDQKIYIGNVGSKGFILKRNFGNRRLPVFGKVVNDKIEVEIKNEAVHTYTLWIAVVVMLAIMIVAILQQMYPVAGMMLILIALMFLVDKQHKKKEMGYFLTSLREL